MKIKILTFHAEVNYGANLQAYALKEYLVNQGHDVEFIDFHRGKNHSRLVRFIRNNFSKSFSITFKKISTNISNLKFNARKKKVFVKFRKENIPISRASYYSIKDLRNNSPIADAYIVGSDQVWSEKIVLNKDFEVFFLNFGSSSTKRLAYAASSGGELFSSKIEALSTHLLKQFDFVGVREYSLKSYLNDLKIGNLNFTPDPTFLINWVSLLKLDFSRQEKKIGTFCLSPNNQNKLHLAVSYLQKDSNFIDHELIDLSKQALSPFDWIKGISSNQVFFTDSYHAVLFSLFTSTPFFFIKWGQAYMRDQRVLDLLKLFDLEFLAIDYSEIEDGHLGYYDRINWSKVNNKIVKLRLIGVDSLTDALN
jgi:hypothetical protein